MSQNTIFLNSSNAVSSDTTNSTYRFNFPYNITLDKHEVALSSLNIYYSWRNITASYGNNTFSYIWPGGGTVSITGNTTNSSNSITSASSTNNYAVGDTITGTGIPSSTTITAISGSTLTISNNATATGSGVALTITNASHTYAITIPDGFYSVNDLNNYLIFKMIANNTYLIDNNAQNHYYLDFLSNSTAYAVQFDSLVLPTSLKTGWSIPTGANWTLPSVASNPQLIMNNNQFGLVVGITGSASSPVNYPSSRTYGANYSHNSDFTPEVSPVSACLISCSLAFNKLTGSTSIIGSFSPTVSYGQIITINFPTLLWTDIQPATYTNFVVGFLDQNNNPLNILDTALSIGLIIREKQK